MQRRLAGEPLQHVLGHWGFRTLEVAVDSRVLVPRPETETVVTFALAELDRLRRSRPASSVLAVDLGTGSGVIALSLVAERAALRVIATDRDPPRSRSPPPTVRGSRPRQRRRVQFRQGDWYQALPADARSVKST